MDIQEALNFLRNLTKFGFNFGLGRIEELLRRTGNPHKKLKVIHVGGTNGKGSTCAMIAGILNEAGYKTGMFTSPHLHSYCERFRINGEEIKEEKLADLLTMLRPHLEKMVEDGFEHPTEFEVSTALAFNYFYQENVDFLVLEVGLGGAIDSTNVVTPLVSVITNVAMDHMDYLGNTLKEIAGVKSGIIKREVPVVTATDELTALEVIREKCREEHSVLTEVGRDVTWQIISSSVSGQVFNLFSPEKEYTNLKIKLVGTHQVVNAATAIAAVEALEANGHHITEKAIKEGLMNAFWPARLEMVNLAPRVVLDGAHNYHGAVSLMHALTEVYSYKDLVLVIGMLGDKEREKVVAELAPLAKAIVVTKPNSPRAGNWQKIASEARKFVDEIYIIEDIPKAVKKGMSLANTDDLVCVTGSLYMVSEAREMFK